MPDIRFFMPDNRINLALPDIRLNPIFEVAYFPSHVPTAFQAVAPETSTSPYMAQLLMSETILLVVAVDGLHARHLAPALKQVTRNAR